MCLLFTCVLVMSFCLVTVGGQIQWKVERKVTGYGQDLVLFCEVKNCCSSTEQAGWSADYNPIYLDVRHRIENPKYDARVDTTGFSLVIRNLTKNDINKTYICTHGFENSKPQFLGEMDAFFSPVEEGGKEDSDKLPLIISVCVGGIGMSIAISILGCYMWRRRRRKRSKTGEASKSEVTPLNRDNSSERKEMSTVLTQGNDQEELGEGIPLLPVEEEAPESEVKTSTNGNNTEEIKMEKPLMQGNNTEEIEMEQPLMKGNNAEEIKMEQPLMQGNTAGKKETEQGNTAGKKETEQEKNNLKEEVNLEPKTVASKATDLSSDYKQGIRKNYEAIVKGIDSTTLDTYIDRLYSEYCFNEDDRELINAKTTSRDKVRKFLDRLMNGSCKGYSIFIELLKKDEHFKELAEQIETANLKVDDNLEPETAEKNNLEEEDNLEPETVASWIGVEYITEGKSEKQFRDVDILNFSKAIHPQHFIIVGTCLGLDTVAIEYIEYKYNRSPASVSQELLFSWRNRLGNKATVMRLLEKLFEALKHNQMSVIRENIITALKNMN